MRGKSKKGFRCCVGLAEIIWEACVFLYPTTNFFYLFLSPLFAMVRIKNRWILFELIENPVFENGQVVFPRTTLGLTEEDIGRAIAAAINADFGDYGLGMAKSLNGISTLIHCNDNDQFNMEINIMQSSGTIQ